MNWNLSYSVGPEFKRSLSVCFVSLLVMLACLSCSAQNTADPNLNFEPPDGSEVYVGEAVNISVTIRDCVFDLCNATLVLSAEGAGVDAENFESVTDEVSLRAAPNQTGDLTVTLERADGEPFSTSVTLHAVERPVVSRDQPAGDTDDSAISAEPVCGDGNLEASEVCEVGNDTCVTNEACNVDTCQCEPTGTIEVLGGGQVYLRTNAGPDCEVAELGTGDSLILDARSPDEPVWYHVQDAGWVFSGALEQTNWTFTADPTSLPVDEEALGCE